MMRVSRNKRLFWIGFALLAWMATGLSYAAGNDVPAKVLKKVLIVTGQDYPGHKWPETAPVLAEAIGKDPRLQVKVTEDPKFLASAELNDYDVIVLHFMDWEQPDPGEEARAKLKRCVEGGKGLVLVHFACGAFQEWPEFRALAGRVWDPKLRGHDPFGTFRVEITEPEHPIMKGMKPFDTTDELYTCLTGDRPIQILAKARSKVDDKDYPMAFVFDYGKGRVFHSVLGHDAPSLANPPVAELFRRACAWAAGLDPVALPKKVVLIAGKASHGAGEHDYDNGVRLLKQCLDTSPNIGPIETETAFNGWPEDPAALDTADTIVVYADGYEQHPFFASPEHEKTIARLMERGTGLVCLHYAVAPRRTEEAEATFMQWIGGLYKDGYSKNPINEVEVISPSPEHPIGRGLTPYTTKDEFYYQIKFTDDAHVTPIATAMLPKDNPKPETLAWAFERPNGGRSFGFTGGHFHKNWDIEPYRKMVLNAILWTAGMDVPKDGVESKVE